MRIKRLFQLKLLVIVLMAFLSPVLSGEPAERTYVRYLVESPAKFETSIIRYRSPKGKTLDLISAVHVGSASYYETLNKRFQQYDRVLFELIIPEDMVGEKLPAVMQSEGGLSDVQNMMARSMGLTTQVGSIDYSADNLVHADLTAEQFYQRMKDNNENVFTYLSKVLSGSQSSSQLGITDQELADLSFLRLYRGKPTAQDRKTMRKLFAHTLTEEVKTGGVFGDTTLIRDRNRAALSVLEKELEGEAEEFALYYGAAHMDGLSTHLEQEGWTLESTSWLTAWEI